MYIYLFLLKFINQNFLSLCTEYCFQRKRIRDIHKKILSRRGDLLNHRGKLLSKQNC